MVAMRLSLVGVGQCTAWAAELGRPATSDASSSLVTRSWGFPSLTSGLVSFVFSFLPLSLTGEGWYHHQWEEFTG